MLLKILRMVLAEILHCMQFLTLKLFPALGICPNKFFNRKKRKSALVEPFLKLQSPRVDGGLMEVHNSGKLRPEIRKIGRKSKKKELGFLAEE